MEPIKIFEGKYAFLSNFWEHPISWNGLDFYSVEAAYQSAKALTPLIQREFTSLNPSQAKKKGRNIQIRLDWNEVRLGIMEELVRIKFTTNPALKKALIETGDAHLEEGNWWKDTFWGVCNGIGENNLGKILMRIREEIRSGVV